MPKSYKGDKLKKKIRELWLDHASYQIDRSSSRDSQRHVDVLLALTDEAVDALYLQMRQVQDVLNVEEVHILIAVSSFVSGAVLTSALHQSISRSEREVSK